MIPTIRYADAIMGLGAAVFMLYQIGRIRRIWMHYLLAGAGVALPLLPLLIRNQLLLGAFSAHRLFVDQRRIRLRVELLQGQALPIYKA